MKPILSVRGRVVVSKQGHDAGRWYCVSAIDEKGLLLCCDGKYRKLNEPKKKQEKHLRALPLLIDLDGKGGSGGVFNDGDLAKVLKQMRLQYKSETEWNQEDSKAELQDQQKEECALVQK